MLALDPWAVVGPGFQLSFVAVAAIHGLAPRIRSWLEGTPVPLRLCSPLAVSLACTVATAPVALAHFGRTSLVASLPANLLALPAIAPLLWLALAACVLWPVAPQATVELDSAVRALGAYIGLVARIGAWLDGALPGRALLLACLAGVGGRLAVRRPSAALAGALAGLLLGLALAVGASPSPAAAPLRVTFLDVGQGDAALIEAPGLRALVDTGPPDARVERLLRRRGVTSLDALLLSHDETRPRRAAGRDPAQPARRAAGHARAAGSERAACSRRGPRLARAARAS